MLPVSPQIFAGMEIIFSPNALEKTNTPRRKHKWTGRKTSTGQYHWRIQKKWNKRFGFEMLPCIYQTRQGFIAHPSLKAKLEAALATH